MQLAQRSPRVDAALIAFGNPRIEDKYDLPGAEVEVKQLAQLFPRNNALHGRRRHQDAVPRGRRARAA